MNAAAEMPKYESHKIVHALQIAVISPATPDNKENPGGAEITPVEGAFAPFIVDAAYMDKHQPKVGGYYVVYKDGYKSFSPKEAFEEGYTVVK